MAIHLLPVPVQLIFLNFSWRRNHTSGRLLNGQGRIYIDDEPTVLPKAREAAPVTLAESLLLGALTLACLGLGIAGLVVPLWLRKRWQGGWRLALGVPVAITAFVVLRLMADVAADPTSHSLWPFELLMTGVVGMVWIGGLALLRWLLGSDRR